jgi:hypothetical protein
MFGLFGKRKEKDKATYGTEEPNPPAPGWDAIDSAFDALYPGQKPKHWAHKGVKRMHDLRNPPENPLDGVSVYDGGSFWHYVTYGLSELYEKESEGEWSGFGYELTFRLAKGGDEQGPPMWPIDLLVSMARAAYAGHQLAAGHTAETGPIDGRPDTKITALILVEDPSFELKATPHGKLAFIELVGVEDALRERAAQTGVEGVLDELRARDKDLVTRVISP